MTDKQTPALGETSVRGWWDNPVEAHWCELNIQMNLVFEGFVYDMASERAYDEGHKSFDSLPLDKRVEYYRSAAYAVCDHYLEEHKETFADIMSDKLVERFVEEESKSE